MRLTAANLATTTAWGDRVQDLRLRMQAGHHRARRRALAVECHQVLTQHMVEPHLRSRLSAVDTMLMQEGDERGVSENAWTE